MAGSLDLPVIAVPERLPEGSMTGKPDKLSGRYQTALPQQTVFPGNSCDCRWLSGRLKVVVTLPVLQGRFAIMIVMGARGRYQVCRRSCGGPVYQR